MPRRFFQNEEDCCDAGSYGFSCSCHLFKSRDDDDDRGDYLYQKQKDDRLTEEGE